MSWDDATQLEVKLNVALNAFNWPEVETISSSILERIKTEPEQLPESSARRFMQSLRRKRRFHLMTLLAEALLQSGLRTPQIRRQDAQALIDQGMLAAGELILQSIIQDPQGIKAEELEARGLTGRLYKQLYINYNDPTSARNRANLERALNEYLYVYRLDPQQYLWHGINVVALSERARRDNLPSAGLPDANALTNDILATLDERERQSPEPLPAWDEATRMEVYVALGRHKEAADTALRYINHSGADAFELNSTIRQLTEVWQLNDQEPPGNHLLPILKAGHLHKEGATVTGDPKKVLEEADAVGAAVQDLEAIFGPDRMVTLKWYKKGLEQCNAIARVEKRNGKGHGTGWLVKAADFFPGRQGVLLLTNNHVVSQMPNPYAIFPEDAQVNFQALGEVLAVEDVVVWASSYMELDATFLALKGEPQAKPLELHTRAMQMAQPPPRMYIIGHPRGRDLEFSLQDNCLLACNESLLHYRTPTEPGSSGSPVFEPEDWRVVALHHKGSEEMRRIDGVEGTYEANEGIAILTLQNMTQKS
jgi:Trypsin-like peptidase domain/Tetratricopeptide Repeats-Sensor